MRLGVAGGIVAGAVLLPGSAFATCDDYGGGSCGSASSTVPVSAVAPSNPAGHDDGLPFTGGDIVALSLVGMGAVAGGTALVRANRRKAART